MLSNLVMRLFPPWVLAAVAAAFMVAAYGLGRLHESDANEAAAAVRDQARLTAQTDLLIRRSAIAQAAAAAEQVDQARIETRFRTITREVQHVVERPIYRDCRLDPDGLRLLRAAFDGDPAPDPTGLPRGPAPGALPDR
jgi:hypothetical protein